MQKKPYVCNYPDRQEQSANPFLVYGQPLPSDGVLKYFRSPTDISNTFDDNQWSAYPTVS